MADIRRDENKRESWLVTNNTKFNMAVGDLLLLPVIKPGKTVDVLQFYSREKISHSTVLASLLKSGKFSLNKKKLVSNKFPGHISVENIDDAITPAEENETSEEYISHSLVQDLDSDDHLQYLNRDGSRPMTGDLDFGNHSAIDVNQIDYNIEFQIDNPSSGGEPEGRTWWNDTEHTLNISTGLGPVLQVGQEMYVLAVNDTASEITNGQVVHVSGSTDGRATVKLAIANDLQTAISTLGMATQNILPGEEGFITTMGLIRDIDTSLCLPGEIIFLSEDTPGAYINIEPQYPNHRIQLGTVITADALTGQILFRRDLKYNSDDIQMNAHIYNNTYTNLSDVFKTLLSPGSISGGEITQPDPSTGISFNVAAGDGVIRATDGDTSQLMFFSWDESTDNLLGSGETKFVGVEYGVIKSQVILKDENIWDLDTEFPLGVVIRVDGVIHIINNPWRVGDSITNLIERLDGTQGTIKRDLITGGLILSNVPIRYVSVTAGKLWSRLNEDSIDAINTSLGDEFIGFYKDAPSGWNFVEGLTQWPNDSYDDGSGVLQPLHPNRYANLWFYLDIGGHLMMIYGQAEYTVAANSEKESPPSTTPSAITEASVLIGRMIIQEGNDTPISVQTAFETQFTTTQASNHANLSNLNWSVSGHTIDTGIIVPTNRITSLTTLDETYEIVFCDTDGGGFIVNLPSGIEGTHYKIINCGSSGNDVVLTPNGAETLFGDASAFNILDAEILDIHYNSGCGWW